MSSVTPPSPAPFSHTWKRVKGQAGLSDPQAGSAGSGQRLLTTAVWFMELEAVPWKGEA